MLTHDKCFPIMCFGKFSWFRQLLSFHNVRSEFLCIKFLHLSKVLNASKLKKKFFFTKKICSFRKRERKIAPRVDCHQKIPPWVRVRVWVRIWAGGNLLGGGIIFQGAISLEPFSNILHIKKKLNKI